MKNLLINRALAAETKKLFILLFALVAGAGTLFASDTQVNGIWYDFDSSSKSATVTYRGSSSSAYSDEYTGLVAIPASVTYNNVKYSVTSIGSGAFSGCTGLTYVTIPNSVASIKSYAFLDCSSLTYVEIPNSVTSIGYHAFEGCSSLTAVPLPNSLTDIGEGAFMDCTSLTSVTIPNSITRISNYTFQSCTSLTSVTIPNSVTSIGWSAFHGCSSLTSLAIPSSITSIEYRAFYNCTGLTSVYISDIAAWCAISFANKEDNPLYYAHNLYLNYKLVTDLVIPNSVTSIGNYAFYCCYSLTSVTIPNSVTRIGAYAFESCYGLTSVTIPSSVTSILKYAFSYCYSLTSVKIPNNVATIGENAFYYVPNIVYSGSASGSPWGARSVNGYVDGYLVYSNATKTTLKACSASAQGQIVIPSSVTSIGNSAFSYCSGLTSATIPNSVTSIGSHAFYGCKSLTSIEIPNSVTSIGVSGIFSGCSGLTFVKIPSSVTRIVWSAFDGCTKLSSIVCEATTPPTLVTSRLDKLPYSGITLYVPANSVSKYKSNDKWKAFNIQPISYYTITWKNWDGTTLKTEQIIIGMTPTYTGTTPTRPATAEYTYKFKGWNPAVVASTANKTYTATYTQTKRKYSISLSTSDAEAGSVSGGGTYEYGAVRTITATPNAGYRFAQWSDGNADNPRSVTVVGNATYTAIFEPLTYTITFDANGGLIPTSGNMGNTPSGHNTSLSTDQTTGTVVVATKKTFFSGIASDCPSRLGHTFKGWYTAKTGGEQVYDATGHCVTGTYWDADNKWIGTADLQLYAQWSVNSYTITWQNEDGSLIDQTTVEYGATPTHAIPTKHPTTEYIYVFAGWTPEIIPVVGETVYTAIFNSVSVGSVVIPEDQFTFVSRQDRSNISLRRIASHQTLEYSFDGNAWANLTTATTITLNSGVSLYIRGKLVGNNSISDRTQFAITGKVEAHGNINYLWDYEDLDAPLKEHCGGELFNGCKGLISIPELPATVLAGWCYHAMFLSCTNLTTAPELPAIECAPSCYRAMFQDCSSLTTVLNLPATTLADNCYKDMFVRCTNLVNIPNVLPSLSLDSSCYRAMFYACSSLTAAPMLPATELAVTCYHSMFNGCTSLTIAPELPATILAESCYQSMFNGCTSLTVAPELPAVTLANRCYYNMFKGSGLVNAPILPATTLADGCYMTMFLDCSDLTGAPALPSTTLAKNCYRGMFQGCTSLATTPRLPATTLADTCYRSMFNGCTSIVRAPVLPAKTLTSQCYRYMFSGCSSLNYIKCLATNISAAACTNEWVKNVASTGTFVCPTSMTAWTRGNNGVPTNWTISKVTPYFINFDANGGLLPTSSGLTTNEHLNYFYQQTGYVIVYSNSTAYNAIGGANPSRLGHTFKGWYTAKTDGEQVYDATGNRVVGTYWDADNKWIGTADIQLYAQWSVNSYTITWQNEDGSLIDQTTVEYGIAPTHADPIKPATAEYTYTFAGWTPEVVSVTGDATYTAIFTPTIREYAVTFKDDDGSIISSQIYQYGQMPIVPADPTKAATAEYTYIFASWDKTVTTVTGDVVYTAIYTATKNSYTITWQNEDGSLIDQTTVEYGQIPAHAEPVKLNTAEYTYTFAGWTPAVVAVTGDATYKATFTATKNKYLITFRNDDGTVLKSEEVEYGMLPIAPATPTKESTAQYNYEFAGWTPSVTLVSQAATYTATYNSSVREYLVTFLNDDNSIISMQSCKYGSYPTIPSTPTKQATAEFSYTFAGWTPNIVAVTGDAAYTATFTTTKNSYSITWQNEDGSLIDQTTVEYGIVPTHADPIKQNTAEYTYTFAGWTPVVVAVTGDATYKATFTSAKNSYTITWQDENGSLIDQTTVEYGQIPAHADPVKQNTAEYTYTFTGWTPAVVAVTGDATYKATFTATKNSYTITWQNEDGSLIDQTTVEYGVVPTHAEPTKEATEEYTYTFTGWTPAVVAVTGDATYKATFSSVVNVYTITVNAVNGQVLGGGEYQYGTTTDLTAIPNEGYVFDQWSDGVKDSPRTITVTGDAEYTALFTSTEGFENIYTSEPVQKVIIDQKVYILRGEKVYTLTGQEVK